MIYRQESDWRMDDLWMKRFLGCLTQVSSFQWYNPCCLLGWPEKPMQLYLECSEIASTPYSSLSLAQPYFLWASGLFKYSFNPLVPIKNRLPSLQCGVQRTDSIYVQAQTWMHNPLARYCSRVRLHAAHPSADFAFPCGCIEVAISLCFHFLARQDHTRFCCHKPSLCPSATYSARSLSC